jgi:hypothetical protein
VQLEIEGIGQQKASLSDWKVENNIYTHHAPHMEGNKRWTCWAEIECPAEFLGQHGDHNMGFGETQKAAIQDFCKLHNVAPPFWWSN